MDEVNDLLATLFTEWQRWAGVETRTALEMIESGDPKLVAAIKGVIGHRERRRPQIALGRRLSDLHGVEFNGARLEREHSPTDNRLYFTWVWPYDEHAELDWLAEEVAPILEEKVNRPKSAIGQLNAAVNLIERFDREEARAIEAAEGMELRRELRRDAARQRGITERAERDRWCVELKIPTRAHQPALRIVKPIISPRSLTLQENGCFCVPCASKDIACDLAAQLQPLLIAHRGQANVVIAGDTAADRRRHEIAARAAKRQARRNRRPPPLDEGCASERAALWAAVGVDSRPGAPGFSGAVAWQAMPRRGWNI